jgi:hypothetical protein
METYKLYIKDKEDIIKVIERKLTKEHFQRLESNLDTKDPNGYVLLKIIKL